MRAYAKRFEVNMNEFEKVQKLKVKVICCQTPTSIDQYSRIVFHRIIN